MMKRYIFHSLEAGPKAIARILRIFPADRLDERIEVNRFSARELIAHLSDVEEVHLDRIHCAISQPGYRVEAIDADQRAAEHHYAQKEIFHEVEVYDTRREMTLDYLRDLSDEQLHTKLIAPSGDEIDILTYAMSMVSHDMYHLEQLTMYLANEAVLLH